MKLYIDILTNKNVFFFPLKNEGQKCKSGPGGWYQWEGGGYKERV
jgi:hypothetical protein